MKNLFLTGVVVFITLLICGCVPIRTSGTTHYLVIGIGVVSVNNTNQYAASITTENVLGGYVTDNGIGFGYKSSNQIMVNTNSDMDIEVSNVPFNPLKINVK